MGIKGIYKEIGSGKRISLTKLAVDKLEQTGRPFRLAIDISIWQFQAQAARGGCNPAIRTLFYRLLRLLGLSIQPIFVFDGPNKPVFKRNKRSGRGDGVASSMAKRMIRLFGFEAHDAPGEAEAECALLQQHEIVDAVLSEDVDTIMFGCKRTLRNWSSENTKGGTPTHVSMHEVEELRQGDTGLDREGMVLVALMSGGDYLPEGIPGAGVKLACEAARAGFGKRLCQIKRADTSELNSWREWLIYELRTNESGFFRTRHRALHVPESFPNIDVLRYYTHPVVSPASTLEKLRTQTWGKPIDVQGLREFARETFDWNYRIGAVKFIRVLAPCLLVQKLMDRGLHHGPEPEEISAIEKEESQLVSSIKNRREHFSTDATPELRLSFIPTDIVGYNFQEEPDEVISYGRDGLALNSDDEFEALAEDGADLGAKTASKKPFSPTEPVLLWTPETIAKFGIPLMVENWEAAQRTKASTRQKTKAPKQKTKSSGGSTGTLDKFARVSKNIPRTTVTGKSSIPSASQPREPPPPATAALAQTRNLLGVMAAPSQSLPPPVSPGQDPEKKRRPPSTRSSRQTSSTARPNRTSTPKKVVAAADSSTINPWTIASSQASPRSTIKTTKKSTTQVMPSETIVILSSPPESPRSPVGRQQRPPTRGDSGGISPSSPPPSPARSSLPNKRRSATPPPYSPTAAPPPSSSSSCEKPRRGKLARTESLPVEFLETTLPRRKPAGRAAGEVVRGGLTRAQTIAAAAIATPSGSGEEGGEDAAGGSGDGDADSDLDDLPPLSGLVGGKSRLPTTTTTTTTTTTITAAAAACSTSRHEKQKQKQQPITLLDDDEEEEEKEEGDSRALNPTTTTTRGKGDQRHGGSGGGSGSGSGPPRMTRLYVPRKSQPGFFKEVDVTVAEAELLKAHVAGAGGPRSSGRAWRRSDIACIDLTGDD